MIPMECPKCGRQGEVPLDRLNSKLTCKKCGTIFHMDGTGHIVLGDPGVEAQRRHTEEVKRRSEELRRRKAGDVTLAGVLKAIPKGAWFAAAALALLIGGGLVARRVVGSMGVPAELGARSTYVGEHLVDLHLEEIKKLTRPSTHDDLRSWYDKVRPMFNHTGPRVDADEVVVFSTVTTEKGSQGETMTTLRLADASTSAPASESAPRDELTVHLHWAREDGQWLIDGTRTLAEANKPIRRRPAAGSRRGASGGL